MSASSKKKNRKEQKAAALTQKQLQQKKEAQKLKRQTLTFVAIIALVLVIAIGSLAVTAYKNSGITERNKIALTVGDHDLTVAELNYFYFDAINTQYKEWYETYGENMTAYLTLFEGLDLSKPLNEQIYDQETNTSFADYFIDVAIQRAINAYTLYDLAVEANNFNETDNEYIDYMVDATVSNVEYSSQQGGYNNLNKYLKSYYGNGATEKAFRDYVKLMNIADLFATKTYNGLTYTESDLAAYDAEHHGEFSSYNYASFYVSVNDHLVCTADESESGHEHTQEEQAQALLNAEVTIKTFEDANITTVEEFNNTIQSIELYKGNESKFCVENKDKLYSSVAEEEIAEWMATENPKPGDVKVFTLSNETTNELGQTVAVPYGFYVVLYQGVNENEMKLVNVRHILKQFTEPTTDPEGNTVYLDADKRKEEITAIMSEWIKAGQDEATFEELASKNTDDTASAIYGGLYENVYPGQMATAFNDWCFDETRKAGDNEIIETEYGYHLMYFSGYSDVTFRNFMIENTLRNQDYNDWHQEQIDGAAYTIVDTSLIKTDIVFTSY